MSTNKWEAVNYKNCRDINGPFYHGTKSRLEIGELLTPGRASNYEHGRISNNVYFSALMEPAIWAAELAVALSGAEGPGHIYIVVPEGVFEDDPNLTNKRFPGNPTCSYRTKQPLRIVGEVHEWNGHPTDVLLTMVEGLREKLRTGTAPIED